MFSLHLLNLLGLVFYRRFQLVNWFKPSFSWHLLFHELCFESIILLLWNSANLGCWWSHISRRCEWHLFLHWSIRLRFSTLATFTTLICCLLVLARFSILPKRKDEKLYAEISFEKQTESDNAKYFAHNYFIPTFGHERLLWPNMSVCDHLRHSQVSVDCFRNQFITDFTTLYTTLPIFVFPHLSHPDKKLGLLASEIVLALSLISLKFTRTWRLILIHEWWHVSGREEIGV